VQALSASVTAEKRPIEDEALRRCFKGVPVEKS
jgi:hypothetical protein